MIPVLEEVIVAPQETREREKGEREKRERIRRRIAAPESPRAGRNRQARPMRKGRVADDSSNRARWMARALYLFATIQLVWACHSRVPTFLHLQAYENGQDMMPCQARVLLALALRWAHDNPILVRMAAVFSASPIYRSHILPESFVLAIGDVAGIVLAGWAATRIYQAASKTKILTAYVYPLVLVFCAVSYVLVALHAYRFYYDMPSLGFFAVGTYLIYFRRHPLLFAGLFLVATLNRETTLLLLWMYVLAAMVDGDTIQWRRAYAPRTLAVVIPLGLYWLAWHLYAERLFAHNHFAWIPAIRINTVLLIWPPAWPQMLAAGGFSILPILYYRRRIADPTLRVWLWVLPAWFAIMFLFGILVEIRLYAELVPYLACVSALLVEQGVLARLRATGWCSGEVPPIRAQ